MLKTSRTGGFTYIEVMIASVLVSVFMVPIFMSLYQTTQKILYAQNSYIGSIHAENLLMDGAAALDSVSSNSGVTDITELIPDFDTRYDTNTFDYALIFYPSHDLETAITYSTKPNNLDIKVDLYTEDLENYFDGFTLLGSDSIFFDGSTVQVAGGSGSTTITLPYSSDERVTLPITNAGFKTANINIYGHQNIDARIVDGSVLIRYFDDNEPARYIIKAVVLDARGFIIKNAFKFSA